MTDTLNSRHRTAWLILLGSFFVCAAVVVATPLMLNNYIRTATRPMEIVAVANQGTVGIYHAETDTRAALFAGDPTLDVAVGSQILTNAADSALLVFYAPGRENVLARLLIYGNSNLTVEEADAPRFGAGSVDERARVTLASGRARLTIPGENSGGARVTIETPQGQVEAEEPGLYSIIVSNAATDPWDYTTGDPVDNDLQKRLYEGFFESWYGDPQLGGFSIWEWSPTPDASDEKALEEIERGYTPEGKPAEKVLREWLAKPAWAVR